jgi:TonB-dependent receptor
MKLALNQTIARSILTGSALWALAFAATSAAAQGGDSAKPAAETDESIIVTGYRASLTSAAAAKREAITFSDSIFAEDIGKFPDTNIAESLNRIPGITISREINGDGLNVAIRGLGTNFTRVLLNGAPVAMASTGRTDSQNTNREVDLDLLPTELFTQLTVSKSPTAGMIEGGAAGTINMRSARPFDHTGTHVTYGAQLTNNSNTSKWGYRGSVLASTTMGDFGILVGLAGVRSQSNVSGFETIGWTNANLSTPPASATAAQIAAAQCRTTPCNTTGGGNWTIPATVPANAGNGLTTGTQINQDLLLQLNPGATIQQLDNGIIPRLGRPANEYGTRDRYNAILSLQYQPSDSLNFYVDSMYGRKKNNMQRTDMNWVGRNGSAIPLNLQFDRTDCSNGCVVTKGTFANAQFFLEYRPYKEDIEFWGVNPGVDFKINDMIKGSLQANYTESNFRRESPSVVVITPASSGITVDYTNDGGIPQIKSSQVNLNDPTKFGWPGGRVNLQNENRHTLTKGVHGDLSWGDKHFSIKVGAAYDDTSRRIRPSDNSQFWQNATCGNNPSVQLPGPNGQPPCNGDNIVVAGGAAPPAGYPTYPAYGTGYTAGGAPISYAGSLVPQSSLGGYLKPGPYGYITVDWDKFRQASKYDQFLATAPENGGSNTGAKGGYIREKVVGAYAEVNGQFPIGDNTLRVNGGIRYVHTDQTIGGLVGITDPRNNIDPDGAGPLAPTCPGGASFSNNRDGSCYPGINNFVQTNTKYENWLPSISGALSIGDHAVIRASVSRTMTRPDPTAMLPGIGFSSPSADSGTISNPSLSPYISNNIDIGFEYYTSGEGLIGVAAFRKSITGFTVNDNKTMAFSSLAQYGITYDTLTPTQQTGICGRVNKVPPACTAADVAATTVTMTQQVNASGKLVVNGLEVQYVQPLDFVLGKIGLNGFGFQGNLTIVDQQGKGTGAPAVAIGVSPMTYVLTGYYDRGAISARLSYTFNEGSQASGTNQNSIPNAAIWGDDYSQLDLSASLDLAKVFGHDHLPQLTIDATNITKSHQRAYFQFSNATFTEYVPGRGIMIGLRGKF